MISLWFSLAILLVLASAFILWPLAFVKPKIDTSAKEINKTWYAEQLQLLEKSLTEKNLSQESFEKNKVQLQKDYLLMIENDPVFSQKPLRILSAGLMLFLAFASFWTYKNLGASKALAQINETKKIDAKISAMGGESGILEKLQARLKTSPTDPQGWYLLGRIYFSENRYQEATQAFSKAAVLAPSRADIATAFAEASYLSQLKTDRLQAHQRLQKALRLDPKNPVALNLSALMLYHEGKYSEALKIWQALLAEAPENSDSATALQSAIQEAKRKIKGETE